MTDIKRFDTDSRLSMAVAANGFVFLSGVTARDLSVDTQAQTADILEQIETYLQTAGSSKARILSASIWLTNIDEFEAMNAAWEKWLPAGASPARATVEARLAGEGYRVEIAVQALQ